MVAQVKTEGWRGVWTSSPKLRYAAELVLWTGVFFTMSRLGLVFANPNLDVQVSPVQPGAGVGIAVLLLRGYRVWPAMLVAGVLSRFLVEHNLLEALGLGVGGMGLGLFGVWLLQRLVGKRIDFGSIRSVLGFLWWGAIVRSMLLATWAVGFLALSGGLDWDKAGLAWVSWFVGTAMGVAVFGSCILTWAQPPAAGEGEASRVETLILLGLLSAVAMLDYYTVMPLDFLAFPLLIWAAMRLDTRALTTAVMLLVMVTLAFTAAGLKTFGLPEGDPTHTVVVLELFIICVSGTGLVLGAVATERRRTQKATAQMAAFQKAMLDSSNFGIIVNDENGRVRGMNRGAERMFGYTEHEFMQLPPAALFVPEEVAERARELAQQTEEKIEGTEVFWHLARRGMPYEREWTFVRRDGTRFPGFLSVTPVVTLTGQRVGFMGIVVDISIQREAQSQMQEARARVEKQAAELAVLNADKDRFFSIIAHDLRGPMAGLMGLSESLANSPREFAPAEVTAAAGEMAKSARNIHQLLENLLEWAQLQTGRMECRPERLELDVMLGEMAELFAPTAQQKGVTMHMEGRSAKAWGDRGMVQAVLRNLVSNALKFTPPGGLVRLRNIQKNGSAIIEVSDTGVGMGEKEISRLFALGNKPVSRVGTAGEGGTGMGLVLCHELLVRNAGVITARSGVGKGSTFTVTLPREARTPKNS